MNNWWWCQLLLLFIVYHMHNVIPTREPNTFLAEKEQVSYQSQYFKGILLYSWIKSSSQRQRFCVCVNPRGYFHPKFWKLWNLIIIPEKEFLTGILWCINGLSVTSITLMVFIVTIVTVYNSLSSSRSWKSLGYGVVGSNHHVQKKII